MMKSVFAIAAPALAVSMSFGTNTASAATVAFSGNTFNVNSPPVNDGSCASTPDRPLRLKIGPPTAAGTSNLGSFTYTQTHCTTGGPGPFSGGAFEYSFANGEKLSGIYSGLLSVGTTQGLLTNVVDFVVNAGTGQFSGATGGFRGVGTVDFRNPAAPEARLALQGNLNLVSGVPEPASWIMLIVGFGAVGAAVRRRRAADFRLA